MEITTGHESRVGCGIGDVEFVGAGTSIEVEGLGFTGSWCGSVTTVRKGGYGGNNDNGCRLGGDNLLGWHGSRTRSQIFSRRHGRVGTIGGDEAVIGIFDFDYGGDGGSAAFGLFDVDGFGCVEITFFLLLDVDGGSTCLLCLFLRQTLRFTCSNLDAFGGNEIGLEESDGDGDDC